MEANTDHKLQVSKSRIYEIAIVATMSSGKSTLINALIGKTLLPSRNQACTNCITSVLDNDHAESATVHVLRANGSHKRLADCDAQTISDMLHDEGEVSDMLIECDIRGIRNIKKSVLVVDTPGVNNADDMQHAEITHAYLQSVESGSIVYLLNAAAIGTSDDAAFLSKVRQIMQDKPGLQIVFVLNKADLFDTEEEPLDTVMHNCVQYLRANGFDDPTILPVSSSAALLFKRVIGGDSLPRSDRNDFLRYYELFRSQDLRLSAFARRTGDEDRAQTREIGGRMFLLRDLYSALENTGCPLLEDVWQNQMTNHLRSRAPRVRGTAQKEKAKQSEGQADPAAEPTKNEDAKLAEEQAVLAANLVSHLNSRKSLLQMWGIKIG